MKDSQGSQRERLLALFRDRALMRASELKEAGITPDAIARAVEDGDLERLSRGLYQRCKVDLHRHHALAVAAMRVPRGVVAMISALGFHGVIDEEHPRVWMAIGPGDWAPGPASVHPCASCVSAIPGGGRGSSIIQSAAPMSRSMRWPRRWPMCFATRV